MECEGGKLRKGLLNEAEGYYQPGSAYTGMWERLLLVLYSGLV